MKKKSMILGALALLMMVAVSWAQEKGTEKVLGPVIAVEREFALDLNACGDAFEKKVSSDNYIFLGCYVSIFPDNGEENEMSNSVDRSSASKYAVLTTIRGTEIKMWLWVGVTGYGISVGDYNLDMYPELRDITKEDFLKAAKVLIDRFPKVSVKLLKVVR